MDGRRQNNRITRWRTLARQVDYCQITRLNSPVRASPSWEGKDRVPFLKFAASIIAWRLSRFAELVLRLAHRAADILHDLTGLLPEFGDGVADELRLGLDHFGYALA